MEPYPPVCEEHPLEVGDEAGRQAADREDDRPYDAAHPVASIAQRSDERHGDRSHREWYAKRQRAYPIWKETEKII